VDEVYTKAELELLRTFMKTDLKDLPGIEVSSRRILEVGHDHIAWHTRHYLHVVSAVCNITGSIEPQCIY